MHNRPIAYTPRSARRPAGFTLIDILIATVIIGLGMTAMMLLLGAGTQVNHAGRELSTAVFLAEQIRNLSEEMPYAQLAALNGQAYSGCDGNGAPVAGLESYTQTVLVEPIDPVTLAAWAGANPPARRLTVTVTRVGKPLSRLTWLRVAG